MLQPPPILPERIPCGEVIEVDENLAGAIDHRIIFTETSQHKENQVQPLAFRILATDKNLCEASLYSSEGN